MSRAWLIEGTGPKWLGYRPGTLEFAWTTVANDAKKFETETDARVALNALLRQRPEMFPDTLAPVVTEHEWVSPWSNVT